MIAGTITHTEANGTPGERAFYFLRVRSTLFCRVLVIRGKKPDVYAVEIDEPDIQDDHAFYLLNVANGECYRVKVSEVKYWACHCTCMGFSRHKHCKHERAMWQVVHGENKDIPIERKTVKKKAPTETTGSVAEVQEPQEVNETPVSAACPTLNEEPETFSLVDPPPTDELRGSAEGM